MKFRRALQRYGRTPEPETPYQRAGQLWDERIGSARAQAKNWRLMAFGGLFLTTGLSGALVWQSMQSRVVPYVVEVDALGQAQAVAPAAKDYRPTDPQIAFHLARFIEHVRAIPDDPIVVRENWLRAYQFASDKGALALNDYARANDPFAAIGREQVAVDVTSGRRTHGDGEIFRAEVWVESKGQKAIVLGPGGSRLKSIGSKARRELSKAFGLPVSLDIWIKVRKGWTNHSQSLQKLGYGLEQ